MIGSVLYNFGGFVLPFTLVGCCSLFLAVCILFTIPPMSDYKQIDDGESAEKDRLTVQGGIKVKTENNRLLVS